MENNDISEIEFKFKIDRKTLFDLIDKFENRKNKKTYRLELFPLFEVYTDKYYRSYTEDASEKADFLRERTICTYAPSTENQKGPVVGDSLAENVINFLHKGIESFDFDMNTRKNITNVIGQYYTIKKKNIVDGVKNNEEYEICSNENGHKFMDKLISYADFTKYFCKEKRKACIIEPNFDNDLFKGCRLEIVSVCGDSNDSVEDFYIEAEYTTERAGINKVTDPDRINFMLKEFVNTVFEKVIDYEIIPDNWKDIIEKYNKKQANRMFYGTNHISHPKE